ncbi:hypothetical protein EKPJFOCH_1729 [Methylobacterium thuringiense]|uniref:Uncharacterized protein n=1 Tax=Methylobacterium thuringiense TaxID=1003091 RepID=A0ABQ4TIM2_9HYPH|nr:hypothetical protein EKPJFOCH_1729 [Methylobacterium thuringiense]
MSGGMQRAFAAAARTRWDGTLSPEMRRFLELLRDAGGPASPASSHGEQRPRRTCKTLGLAERVLCGDGRTRWRITIVGLRALAQSAPSPTDTRDAQREQREEGR